MLLVSNFVSGLVYGKICANFHPSNVTHVTLESPISQIFNYSMAGRVDPLIEFPWRIFGLGKATKNLAPGLKTMQESASYMPSR